MTAPYHPLQQSGHPWDELAVGTPYVALASATTVRVVEVPKGAKQLALLLSNPTGITSVTVTGLGSGATYFTLGSQPAQSSAFIPVLPSVDDHLTITVVCNVFGPVTVYPDFIYDPSGVALGATGLAGQAVTLAGVTIPQGTQDSLAPTTYSIFALNNVFDGTNWHPAYAVTQGDTGINANHILAAGQVLFDGVGPRLARVANVFKPQNAVNTNAEVTIWTPAAGKKFRLMGFFLQASVAGNILIRDNTGGTIIAVIPSAAGGDAQPVMLGNGILSAAANNVLTAQAAAASTTSGMVFGTEE